MIKAVIFDWWGTLAFNRAGWFKDITSIIGPDAHKLFILGKGREWRLKDKPPETVFSEFLLEVGKPESLLTQLMDEWDKLVSQSKLFPETLEVLEGLKSRGLKLGLVSNTIPITRPVMRRFGVESYFDTVILSCEVGMKKPEPAIFEMALRQLKVSPEETLMIGDQEEKDVDAPKSLGMRALLIDREGNTKGAISDLHGVFDYLGGIK